ncbi:MAG: gluconate transporter [Williamsia sp.]|nr:gluconate transporter [Williamsia sp.]
MTILILVLCIISLVLLITWAKVNAFLAFLIVSIGGALLLGMPLGSIGASVNKGLGDTLGSVVIIIILGAMLGKLVAETGAAQQITLALRKIFGYKYVLWAMALTGFIVGIPLFYNVGFVLLVPIIFSVAHNYKLPLVYVGIPMLASLSVMHGFLPPHPSPMALVGLFHADLAKTFLYGFLIAIPAIIVAGPLFARTIRNLPSSYAVKVFPVQDWEKERLPGTANSIVSSLLPVLLIGAASLLGKLAGNNEALKKLAVFLGEPTIVMTIAIVTATYTLGIRSGRRLIAVMKIYEEAVKEIVMIVLIIGGAGILKQILIDSGVNNELVTILQGWQLPPLLLGWLVAAVLRLCLGSATVAGLTAAGIIFPLATKTHVDPNLLVLAIGSGSLFCSHVNDGAFWLFKEYFGLSMKNTFRSWSLMETIVSVMGLIGVLVVDKVFF